MSSNVNVTINNEIVNSVRNSFLEKVHNRADMISDRSNDIYTSIKSMGYETCNPDCIKKWKRTFRKRNTSSGLMEEILQQIIEEYTNKQNEVINDYINKQITNLKLVPTKNPLFMVSEDGKYYRLEECEYVEEPSVINIDENGSYTVKSSMANGRDTLIIVYDMNHKPLSLKVLNSNNELYKSEKYVAKKLNLKQELVNKFKLHGYSGNSSGIFATVANFLTTPIPSGYFFDTSYNFFKWNFKLGEFQLHTREGKQIGAPLMADYDIREAVVIRTDYDGAGINL